MGKFDRCLLACDIDGTLISDGVMSPRNVEKIKYFLSQGGMFSLSTGRTASAVGMVFKYLDRVSPSVVANGCMIYDFENSKVIYEKVIPQKQHIITKTVYERFSHIGIEIHCGNETYILRRSEESDAHQDYENLKAKLVNFEEIDGLKWNKVLFFPKDPQERNYLREKLTYLLEDSVFIDTVAEFWGNTHFYLEHIPMGVSKASALEILAKSYNIKKGGLFAIGDYYNDLEMIKKADISSATQDAPEDIKKYADFVSGKCENGAVADFIDYLDNVCSIKQKGRE